MFLSLQDEAEMIVNNIVELAYFMRGAMTYESILLTMSYAERQIVSDFLKKRLEQEKDSPYPVY